MSGVHGDVGDLLHKCDQHPGGSERAGGRADVCHRVRGRLPQHLGAGRPGRRARRSAPGRPPVFSVPHAAAGRHHAGPPALQLVPLAGEAALVAVAGVRVEVRRGRCMRQHGLCCDRFAALFDARTIKETSQKGKGYEGRGNCFVTQRSIDSHSKISIMNVARGYPCSPCQAAKQECTLVRHAFIEWCRFLLGTRTPTLPA